LRFDDAGIEVICGLGAQLPPPGPPEVAVIGRSNVGKSSLVNAALGRKGLLRVSQEPGRTREVIFIRVGTRGFVVDLPGYGFARVPLSVKRSWALLVEAYLARRARGLMLLPLDIRREEPSEGDIQMVNWFRHYEKPFSVVLTKADQLQRGRWQCVAEKISKALDLEKGNKPLIVSTKSQEGIEALRRLITQGFQPYGRGEDLA